MADEKDWFDQTMFGMESHHITVDQCSIHYVDQGSGPPLLMVHGNLAWSFLFRRMVPRLMRKFRCIVPDLVGFGRSKPSPEFGFTAEEQSRVLRGLVSSLDLRNTTLITHNWGGPIGLDVLFKEPDRFSHLVAGNAWAWPLTRELAARHRRSIGSPVRRLLHRSPSRRDLAEMFTRRSPTKTELEMYRRPLTHAHQASRALDREAGDAQGFLAELEHRLSMLVGFPAMLIWANADPLAREQDIERWRSLLKNHHLYVLNQAGPMWPDDAGDEAVEAFLEWFSRSA